MLAAAWENSDDETQAPKGGRDRPAPWRRAAPPIVAGLCTLILAVVSALAQDTEVALPPHAHPSPLGIGWQCDWGYRRDGGSCVSVKVPDHAYLSDTGNTWRCLRGYRRQG